MTREDFARETRNYQSALQEMAAVHMRTDDNDAAGLLLVLERRIYQALTEYELRVPRVSEPAGIGEQPSRRRRGRGTAKAVEAPQAELPVEP